MFGSNVGNELTALVLIAAASVTATANGTSIDLQDYAGQGVFLLNCSAATAGTNPTMDVTLEEASDNSTFTAITGGAFTQVTTVAGLQKIVLNTDGLKRYVRPVKTIGGTASPAFPLSCTFVGTKRIPA